MDGASPTKVDDANCDPTKRYENATECHVPPEECKGAWFSGPWSEVLDLVLLFVLYKHFYLVGCSGNCRERDKRGLMFLSIFLNLLSSFPGTVLKDLRYWKPDETNFVSG
jgi:hypothetical protein